MIRLLQVLPTLAALALLALAPQAQADAPIPAPTPRDSMRSLFTDNLSTEVVMLNADNYPKIYTTRPVLLVGTLKSLDGATVVIEPDPKLTSFPRVIQIKAHVLHIDPAPLMERELGRDRAFLVTPETFLVDDTAPLEPQPGQVRRPAPRIALEAFSPGAKVSALYRLPYPLDSETTPTLLNLSLVDPERTYYSADFDPTRRLPNNPQTRRVPPTMSSDQPTTPGPSPRP